MTVRCLHQRDGICPRCRYQERADAAFRSDEKRARAAKSLDELLMDIEERMDDAEERLDAKVRQLRG